MCPCVCMSVCVHQSIQLYFGSFMWTCSSIRTPLLLNVGSWDLPLFDYDIRSFIGSIMKMFIQISMGENYSLAQYKIEPPSMPNFFSSNCKQPKPNYITWIYKSELFTHWTKSALSFNKVYIRSLFLSHAWLRSTKSLYMPSSNLLHSILYRQMLIDWLHISESRP